MSLDGYCIECGAAKIDGDLDEEKWGYEHYEDDPYYALLCPVHYEQWKEKMKDQKREERHYAFIIKQLKKIFPEAIEWLKGEVYMEGHKMTDKHFDSVIYGRIQKRMEQILETYVEKTEKDYRFVEKKIKELIKKFLLDTCAICRHWDLGNVCNKLRCNIVDLVIVRWNKGNCGTHCDAQEIQTEIIGGGYNFNGDWLQNKINKWKKNKAKMHNILI